MVEEFCYDRQAQQAEPLQPKCSYTPVPLPAPSILGTASMQVKDTSLSTSNFPTESAKY